MLLQSCALGVTRSWDDGFLGARASRPHQAWHSLAHLPHLDQPGTAPWLSYGLAAAVPADRVAACSIARKLSDGQRDSMRAGRPRSQGNHSPLEGESQKPSRQAKADAVGVSGGRLLRKPTCSLWETPVRPRAGLAPTATCWRSFAALLRKTCRGCFPRVSHANRGFAALPKITTLRWDRDLNERRGSQKPRHVVGGQAFPSLGGAALARRVHALRDWRGGVSQSRRVVESVL